ncbi:MFS transporter [Streptomyces sp. NPDC089919]|uniref:MFS transporter n=1 Tax=Streptomyces sp. NPDC089919 TaxID=3155188 RepID=UPI00342E7457
MELDPRTGDRRPLTALLVANTVSVTGSALTLIGVPLFVLETTESPARAGVVAFCATLPIVVAALVGGPVIDRIGRRRVSVLSDLVCGLAVGAIPLLHALGVLEFWMLCALMAVSGLVHTPGLTARSVLLPNLAQHAGTTVTRAAGLFDGVSRGARMAGSVLAGVLIAMTGAETVLYLDAGSFLVSAALLAAGLRGVAAADPQRGAGPVSFASYRTELREGYAFLLRTRLLLAVTVMVMVTNGLDQAWSGVLLPVHAKEELGGPEALGLLGALFGGGALVGALVFSAVGERFPRRAVFAVAFLLSGPPRWAVAALTGTTLPLAVTMALGGIGAGMLNPVLTGVVFERVPEELRSRVAGVSMAGAELAMPVGALTAGVLVQAAGVTPALLALGGVYLLATLSPLVFPVWRTMGPEHATVGRAVSRPGPGRPSGAPAASPPRPTGS